MLKTEPISRPSSRRWLVAVGIAAIGVTWQFLSLALIERSVSVFPTVTDVLMDRLPRIDFGFFGESWFFGLVIVFALWHFRRQWQRTPEILMALGLMYFLRGWFLYLFPIGAPYGAVSPDERLSIWGHESHAFFPGGHIAILTALALFAPVRWLRWVLWSGLVIFGIGTLLAKTHYTMDSVGGILLGYAVATMVRQRESVATSAAVQNGSGTLR
ncbi:MAG: phosphatase PAP2 family protein [Candidatus Kerfeldbacteria bacterium]|nr:phosphatase PAP2 family protein [Candidatus Kerfeldbacteria bacterium]